jgi:hypothetical protein
MAANPSMSGIIALIALVIAVLPAFYFVHRTLEYCYFLHARRFCRKQGFKLGRWRCRPAFDNSGIKTEFTIVEVDCVDIQGQRKLVRLLIWIFGIRKVLANEKYPESLDAGTASQKEERQA